MTTNSMSFLRHSLTPVVHDLGNAESISRQAVKEPRHDPQRPTQNRYRHGPARLVAECRDCSWLPLIGELKN